MTPARERTEAAIRDYGDAEYHRALGNNSFQDAMDTKKDLIVAIDAEVAEERERVINFLAFHSSSFLFLYARRTP